MTSRATSKASQSYSVFQLAPLTPRIDGNDIGLWVTPRKTRGQYCTNQNDPDNPILTLEGQLATLPTVSGANGGQTSRSKERSDEMLIGGLVRASWPTQTKRDDKGQTQNPDRMDYVPNIVKGIGQISYGCLAQTENFAVRLMILSAWLMGYRWSYLKHWLKKKGSRKK
jgi:hypothetical protein